MAVGLPVIATKWGGPAEYVDDSCGILVPPDSARASSPGSPTRWSDWRAIPELRHAMGEAGRRKIERFYTWDTKIDRILDFYRQAVQPPRPAALDPKVERLGARTPSTASNFRFRSSPPP